MIREGYGEEFDLRESHQRPESRAVGGRVGGIPGGVRGVVALEAVAEGGSVGDGAREDTAAVNVIIIGIGLKARTHPIGEHGVVPRSGLRGGEREEEEKFATGNPADRGTAKGGVR